MVRLLRDRIQIRTDGNYCFNPTMVRLLRARGAGLTCGLARFNPTMVRLLHHRQTLGSVVTKKFQSHNGAIAA